MGLFDVFMHAVNAVKTVLAFPIVLYRWLDGSEPFFNVPPSGPGAGFQQASSHDESTQWSHRSAFSAQGQSYDDPDMTFEHGSWRSYGHQFGEHAAHSAPQDPFDSPEPYPHDYSSGNQGWSPFPGRCFGAPNFDGLPTQFVEPSDSLWSTGSSTDHSFGSFHHDDSSHGIGSSDW